MILLAAGGVASGEETPPQESQPLDVRTPDAGVRDGLADREVVQRLGADDFTTRQVATEQLLRDPTVTLQRVRRLHDLAGSEEQRQRLLVVARHHVLRTAGGETADGNEQGVIGIRYRPTAMPGAREPAGRGGIVDATSPGFPGHAHLRVGDVIVAVDGRSVSKSHPLDNAIKSKKPGDPVTLTVLRDGERIVVRFDLGSWQAYERIYDASTPNVRLRPPTAARWERCRRTLEPDRHSAPILEFDTERIRVSARTLQRASSLHVARIWSAANAVASD